MSGHLVQFPNGAYGWRKFGVHFPYHIRPQWLYLYMPYMKAGHAIEWTAIKEAEPERTQLPTAFEVVALVQKYELDKSALQRWKQRRAKRKAARGVRVYP